MKKSLAIILGIIALVVVLGGWFIKTRNNLVVQDENVNNAWSNVETAYQRRADLIPQLVNTVKGASNFEKETYTAVTEARKTASDIKLTGDDLTEENIARFQKAYDNLAKEMTRAINVTVEAYPDLKATQEYANLMVQLEGCENRISVERKNFNDVVTNYNKTIRQFPASIVANMSGFEKKSTFKASEGADVAPAVEF